MAQVIEKIVRSHHPDLADAEVKKRVAAALAEFRTKGTFAISGTADLLRPTDSQLRHEVDADLTSVRYPQLGVRIKLLDYGYLGVTYRGETKIKLADVKVNQGVEDDLFSRRTLLR